MWWLELEKLKQFLEEKENEKFEKEIEMDDELASDLAAVELELAEQSFSDNEEDVVSGDTD